MCKTLANLTAGLFGASVDVFISKNRARPSFPLCHFAIPPIGQIPLGLNSCNNQTEFVLWEECGHEQQRLAHHIPMIEPTKWSLWFNYNYKERVMRVMTR